MWSDVVADPGASEPDLGPDPGHEGLRVDELEAPPAVVSAFAATTRSAVAIIAELNTQIAAIEAELADHLEQHPDADIYLSLPGIGVILGARALGEFGDEMPLDSYRPWDV